MAPDYPPQPFVLFKYKSDPIVLWPVEEQEDPWEDFPTFPHCDMLVLHAPGECEYCDRHPDWQKLREAWGINFTGHHDEDKLTCPAELKRPVEVINRWPGNTPQGY